MHLLNVFRENTREYKSALTALHTLSSCLTSYLCRYLFQLDLRVDVDVADLAVEGFVLQARALESRGAAVLQLGSGPRVGFDWASAAPGLQHCLVLGTWNNHHVITWCFLTWPVSSTIDPCLSPPLKLK